MNQVNESEIVNHEGTTCLLPEPKMEDGTSYPFAFDAVRPKEKSWSYRLCGSRDPGSLTNDTLAELLRNSPKPPRADWEEQVGHAVGWITIYVPRPAESGSGAQGHRVRYEQGPEIELAPPQIKPSGPRVTPRERPMPPPPPIDIEMF